MLTGLWRSVHAISARMSILRVEADSLTGKAGRPASKQLHLVGMTVVTCTCKDLTMVKLHAQNKLWRMPKCVDPSTALIDKGETRKQGKE